MSTSPFIREALDTIAELRAEHRENVENQYRRAEEATNGALLNRRGQERGIDPYSLFTHNSTYFRAYASEELVEWFSRNPRLTFSDYERQMFSS